MDEFALCWNNFQDNIASGFQNLYDRGDLVDCTLACEGKLLKAHKIVLAICSPYFQEMFTTNPCKHPIIVLKDVSVSVMTELLQFMYQGEVNVKHTELQSFMKIAETLQIKGLTTSQKSNNQQQAANVQKPTNLSSDSHQAPSNVIETKINSSSPSSSMKSEISYLGGQKRHNEYVAANEPYPIYPKKQLKRTMVDMNETNTSLDSDSIDLAPDEVFMPAVSMIEHNVKRESMDDNSSPNNTYHHQHHHHHRPSLPSTSTPLPLHQGYLYDHNASSGSYSKNLDYQNDLNFPGDFGKGSGHMDIPAVAPGEKWFHGKLQFMLSQRGKPLLVHDGHSFGIQYIRKDKKYWQCNLSRKYNCKARVTTTDQGEIIVTNNEHCHTEIRQHLRKDYKALKMSSLSGLAIGGSSSNIHNLSLNNNNNNNNDNNNGSSSVHGPNMNATTSLVNNQSANNNNNNSNNW